MKAFLAALTAIALMALGITPASAAPVRYEAELATISQGTIANNHAGFSGTGFVDYTNITGSYVEWSVTADIAGAASILIRYANGTTTNRPMDITVNGTLVGNDVAFDGTGGWDMWQTRSLTTPVQAGTVTIRATATTVNGGPNVDYLDFSVVPPTNEYQAEQAFISQGVVEANHLNYTGTGFVNLDNVVGSYLEWTVNVSSGGTYRLTIRFANGTTTNRPMDIAVNGTLVANDLAFNSTTNWDTWQETSVVASLTAGSNTVRATSSTANGGPNLDRLMVNPADTNTIVVSSLSALQSALDNAVAGTHIALTNGTYSAGSAIRLTRSGAAGNPIRVTAQNVGGATITGSSTFSFGSVSYVEVSGFRFTGSASISLTGHHNRFSRNLVQLSSGGNWVTTVGNDIEVDHNTFQNRSSEGVFLQTSGPGSNDMAQRPWIHHNYFLNHSFSGSNGGESIRHGYSFRQLASSFGIIEYNLFEQANGDAEAISVKSSDNIIRYNTLRNSRGSIVLRHGNRNRVEGNIELGGSSGIRFYDNDHVVINNLIQGGTGQIIAGSGNIADDTTGSTEHARPDRVLVAFNTVVGSGVLLDLQGGNTFGPNACTFANNIFRGNGSGVVNISKGTNNSWSGNIVWQGTGGDMPSSGFRSVNPLLAQDTSGLWRLSSASSPAIDTATGSHGTVVLDMDLQTRGTAKDVGADEYSTGGFRRALTAADVGPSAP